MTEIALEPPLDHVRYGVAEQSARRRVLRAGCSFMAMFEANPPTDENDDGTAGES